MHIVIFKLEQDRLVMPEYLTQKPLLIYSDLDFDSSC